MRPKGRIEESLVGHGPLGHDYYCFLSSAHPSEAWEDVRVLGTPIPPKAEYPVDWTLVSRWAASCPPLAGVMDSVQDFDLMGPKLGWSYAWTRFSQHLHLLDVIQELFDDAGRKPTLVLEPGCFTGGLLHFLAYHWQDVPCVGFDVSPVSLDVCSHYCDRLELKNKPVWLEADFAQIQPCNLPDGVGERAEGGLVILSNVIESIGRGFERYPYLDTWQPRSLLISYWVNLGATVLLSERHTDPHLLAESIVERARWEKPGCKCEVMKSFTVPLTVNMNPDNPIGDWEEEQGCVIRFSPPSQMQHKKARRGGFR
jgi:SAM-dependent methyltransferase